MPVIHQKRAQRGCQGKTGSGSLARELQSKSFVTGHVEADDNINSTKPALTGSNPGKKFSGYQACVIM
ncbi:hypothetical protein V2A60_004611 [Cordyceps javanica]